MKKLRLLFSALALLLCSTSLLAHDFEVDGIYYKITSSTDLTVAVSYKGSFGGHYYEYSGSVTIPKSVTYDRNTYSVTSIGEDAFAYCDDLKSVVIPYSVTSIGEGAFCKCDGLTSVTIGNSVTSIGDDAFLCCYDLKSVTIPNSVTSIGYRTFYQCYDLKSVNIPNSVTSIGQEAF